MERESRGWTIRCSVEAMAGDGAGEQEEETRRRYVWKCGFD